jgi:endonuclease/exonuclease/phosphatase family metal-dependent hydrolase
VTTFATWNLGDGSDRTKARGLDRLVQHGADVIGLQEAGDRQRLIDRWCEATGWHAWLGDGSAGAPSVPILWNPKAVRATRTGTVFATGATKVGRLGAGPSTMKPKVWNRVRFEDAPDVVFVNGHIVPSVYLPKRRRLARKQIAVLARIAAEREGRVDVIAVGDFNMKPRDTLTKPLRKLGMHQHTQAPTHGRRTIDLIWTLGCHGGAEVITMPSDHRAVLFHKKES